MNSDGASGEELFQAAVKAAIKLDEIPGECAGEPLGVRINARFHANAASHRAFVLPANHRQPVSEMLNTRRCLGTITD